MEALTPDRGISPEDARGLLIAISQCVPDKAPVATELPKNPTDANMVELNGSGGAEEYRSKLISISYTESPDMKLSPSPLEGLVAHSTGDTVVGLNGGGGAEEYRSKLISISYTESPDMKYLPSSLLESLTA